MLSEQMNRLRFIADREKSPWLCKCVGKRGVVAMEWITLFYYVFIHLSKERVLFRKLFFCKENVNCKFCCYKNVIQYQ